MTKRLQPGALLGAARDAVTGPGLWAAAAALLAQRLLHAAIADAPFAPYACAEWIIRKAPGPIATSAIEHLGHRAQPTLAWSFIAFTLVIGLVAGRRPAWLLATIAFLLTIVAAWLDPLARSVPGAIGSAALAGLTAFLVATALQPRAESASGDETDWARRRLIAGTALGLVFAGVWGTTIFRRGTRATPSGPVRADLPATIPADPAFVELPELSPRVTARAEHYVVDIDLENPYVSEAGWHLDIDGAVGTPRSYSLAGLQAMRTEERLFNVSCISNQVGGNLIGNARWTGVPLDTLLDAAGLQPEAVTLLARSDDGYEEGIPLADIRGKGALIAIAMDGLLLPRDHGFPARLLFPDHYGMRSVKWLTRLSLLDHEQDGYWAQRGWDREAVVRTESRFDLPGDGADVESPVVCAGIAWAGARGISAVEVSPDGGETWQQAQLETELGPLSWRRWRISLDLPRGLQRLAVRAIDGTGTPQDVQERDPHPSGASGYHRIDVTVA